jgi:hypothetical protein
MNQMQLRLYAQRILQAVLSLWRIGEKRGPEQTHSLIGLEAENRHGGF